MSSYIDLWYVIVCITAAKKMFKRQITWAGSSRPKKRKKQPEQKEGETSLDPL